MDGYLRGNTLYLKVVDYKTGKKEFRLSDVLSGLNLQMFLYLMMLKQSGPAALERLAGGRAQRIEPCGALYVPAKTPYLFREADETDEQFQSRLDQELRRIGLVRDDGDLLEAMEHGGRFRFLPVSLKKDGSFTEASSQVSALQLNSLLHKTEETLRRIARQISAGDIEADPYRISWKDSVCRFCDFREACHFDTTMEKDCLRYLPKLKDKEVRELLEKEEEERLRKNGPEGEEEWL